MKFGKLLAKSKPKSGQSEWPTTFIGHISAVLRAAETLNEELAPKIIDLFGLPPEWMKDFKATVLLGAYLHDWGKANQHFQVMVRLKSSKDAMDEHERAQQATLSEFWKGINERQMIRHEILSGVLAMGVPKFRTWLGHFPNADFVTAVWAAMGHHLKIGGQAGKPTNRITELLDGHGTELTIYTDHQNFTDLLKIGATRGLPDVLPDRPKEVWRKSEIKVILEQLHEEFTEHEAAFSEERQRFLAAVKATVVAADIAGSALPAAGENIEKWTSRILKQVLTDGDLQELLDERLQGKSLRPFQQSITETDRRVTLVQAGCGTGKTVAAYAWAQRYAVGKKLFFCYPTTGTASQGYLDYAATTSVESKLMHSRAEIDEVLFTDEDRHEARHGEPDGESPNARLASFGAWQNKLVVCTVDTVLGLIQNNRTPLYSWPALCNAAFVFDEVHAYGDRLFGGLLRFLQTFRKAPVLLMSASFSEGHIAAIEDIVQRQLGETLEIIPGPRNLEELERYQIERIDNVDAAWEHVGQALLRREKVLWVTNTVADCVALYRGAKERFQSLGVTPLIYHSRYRYTDRLNKHRAVVDSFAGDGPVLAVTTQVCEMSLDLSADLLVSALAPAAALIQRLGRLNRKVVEDANGNVALASGKVCPALILPWTKENPYSEPELETGHALLDRLSSGPLRQCDLSAAAAQLESHRPEPVASNWLDKNWRSFPAPSREGGFTLTVLLEEDLPAIRRAVTKSNPLSREAQRWTVPVGVTESSVHWKREGVYPVAPKSEVAYSEETGAESCKKSDSTKSNSTWAIL